MRSAARGGAGQWRERVAPAGVEPATTRVRTGSSAVLSYGAMTPNVTGRGRTCDAPRFRRALYRAELRSREMGGAGVEPAASSSSERRSAV